MSPSELLDKGAVPVTLATAMAAGSIVAMIDPQWITTISTGLLGVSTAVAIVIREYHKSRKDSNADEVEQLSELLADRDQRITELHVQITELLTSNQELMRAVTIALTPPASRLATADAAADPAQPAAVVAVPVVAVPAAHPGVSAAPAADSTRISTPRQDTHCDDRY